MHKSILALASLFLIAAHLTAQPEAKKTANGIYRILEKGDGPKVIRDDTGAATILGERVTGNLGFASITSQSNDNSRFSLYLQNAGPFPIGDVGDVAIVVDGRAFRINTFSGPGGEGSRSVGATVHSADAAKALAKSLGVQPFLRQHPGHKFHVTFTPDRKSYQPNGDMTLTMTIKNVGENTITFMDGGRQRGPRDNQFSFIAMAGHGGGKAVPDSGDPNHFGGIGSYRTLKPGETFKKEVRLDKWFKFEEADSYLVTGMYRLEFYVPNDPQHRILWTDFAVAECVVRVDAGKK